MTLKERQSEKKKKKETFPIIRKVIAVQYEHTGELGKTPSQLSRAGLIMFLYYSPKSSGVI